VFPGGVPEGFGFFAGTGCGRCAGLGALGRIAVVEYLPTGPQMRKAIARDIPLDDLRDEALRSGLVPMREHALRLVHEGIIAFDELPWLLPPERLAPDPKRTP
jgi:type IV pilus assembly protein PilB